MPYVPKGPITYGRMAPSLESSLAPLVLALGLGWQPCIEAMYTGTTLIKLKELFGRAERAIQAYNSWLSSSSVYTQITGPITWGRWRRGPTGSIGLVGPPDVLVAGLAGIVGFQECQYCFN